jgi:hypothetical protein
MADSKPTLFSPGPGKRGMTDLHYAAYCGDFDALLHFLEAGLAVNATDTYRGFISGYAANETEQSRTREMNELIPRLQQMVRQRDAGILQILTAQQADHFRSLQGKSLSIQWDAGEFMRLPFEKKNS